MTVTARLICVPTCVLGIDKPDEPPISTSPTAGDGFGANCSEVATPAESSDVIVRVLSTLSFPFSVTRPLAALMLAAPAFVVEYVTRFGRAI